MAEQKWEPIRDQFGEGWVVALRIDEYSFEYDSDVLGQAFGHCTRQSAQARADQLNEGEGK